jgi:hypothetical protein
MRGLALSCAGVWLLSSLSAAGVGAQPAPAQFDAVKISGQITEQLARHDTDAFAATAGKYMAPSAAGKLKDVFHFIEDLGKSQYTDLVYSRDYGQTEKDIVYKIDFDKAFLYTRFLWHVDNGAWRLIQLNAKTENELPLPGSWRHIYPK